MGIVAGAPGGDRCRDMELPVPVAPGTASKVRRLVRGLSAKGITPPCRALIQAHQHLNTGTISGNLVLLSDGREKCGGDLLETVSLLASKGRQLTVDVFSLGQIEEQNVSFNELAGLLDGRLFDVRSKADAKTVMEVIVQRLVSRSNLSVTAHDFWGNDGFTETPLSWELHGVEGEPFLVGTFTKPALRLSMTPGLYWVVAQVPKKRYGS